MGLSGVIFVKKGVFGCDSPPHKYPLFWLYTLLKSPYTGHFNDVLTVLRGWVGCYREATGGTPRGTWRRYAMHYGHSEELGDGSKHFEDVEDASNGELLFVEVLDVDGDVAENVRG